MVDPRPSIHYPTLELRVADSCTRLEDTLGIAALYRCLVRLLDRSPALNRGQTGATDASDYGIRRHSGGRSVTGSPR